MRRSNKEIMEARRKCGVCADLRRELKAGHEEKMLYAKRFLKCQAQLKTAQDALAKAEERVDKLIEGRLQASEIGAKE